MKKLFKILSTIIATLLLIALILVAVYYGTKENIHTVLPGEYYRSAQLSPEKLSELIKEHHIKSVINLRGENSDKKWYQNEVAVTKELNVEQIDLRMSAYRLPKIDTLKQLVSDVENAPKPVLIHCRNGSDRTGLASVIALLFNTNMPYDEIKKQVTWRYRVVYPTSVGKQLLPLYEQWLAKNNLEADKKTFVQWVKQLQPGPDYPMRDAYPENLFERLGWAEY